jgi:hypothetical protein
MKKAPLFILIIAFLVFSLAGISHSWQGRMAGMGDPYGLIKDESDFLIHPAAIAKGQGINFYGYYRFNYTDVMDRNHNRTYFTPFGNDLNPIENSGHEREQNGLLGAAFPLGPGRMGLFFEYAGKRGDFSGRNNEFFDPDSYFHRFKFNNDLDSFALRLLYGLPVGGFKVGGEIQLAYRLEENKTFINEDSGFQLYWNSPLGNYYQWINLHQFLFPFDSKYWEGIIKGSLKGAIGPAKIAFTMRGGLIFWSDNKYKASSEGTLGPSIVDGSGDVKGWNVGGDFWLRYPLSKDLSIPFLVKINYQDKTRDASGSGTGDIFGFGIAGIGDYKNKEKNFQIEAGAGLDKELTKGTRIAAGLYYNYLQSKNSFKGFGLDTGTGDWAMVDHSNYPDQTEHRVVMKIAGEKELTPMFAMRMGLNFFYGWVKEDFKFNYSEFAPFYSYVDNISLDGSRWGIGAFLGGTVKFERISIEPFVGGGYQKLKLDGDGYDTSYPSTIESDKLKKEWFIGGGFSIKF